MASIEELFGVPSRSADDKLNMAIILRFLAEILSKEESDDDWKDERERGAREIHVRPRVEPLGGA